MRDINWHDIATAIRENRFQDVPTKSWRLIADKIDTAKRGKGRPADPKAFIPLSVQRAVERVRTFGGMEMTTVDRMVWIEERFEELRAEGKKSGEAQTQIATELACTLKTVEANLTDIRKVRKIEHDTFWEMIEDMDANKPV